MRFAWRRGAHSLIHRNKLGTLPAQLKGKSVMDQNGKPPADRKTLAGPDDLAGGHETGKLPARLERYGSGKARGLQMLAHLREHESHEQRAIGFLRDCGDYLVFNQYYTVGETRLVGANFCKQHLICPLCAMRRGAKYVENYMERLSVILKDHPGLRLYMVTFTVKNGDDLEERFQHLRRSLGKLHDRRRDVRKKGRGRSAISHVEGGVWSFEVTNKGQGWHPHVHCIYLAPSAPSQAALRAEWESITRDSFMVDVTPVSGEVAQGFAEVFKYAMKFSEMSLEDNVTAWRTFKGRRLIASFGLFYGVKVPEKLEDDPLDGLPYVQLFYRYLPSGYALRSDRDFPHGDPHKAQAATE